MRMKSLGLLLVGVALVGAGVGWGMARTHRPTAEAPRAAASPATSWDDTGVQTIRFFRDPTPAPAFTLKDLDGRPITSADLRGKVTLINFWATWCGPCRAEIPDLIALQQKYRDQLQIIGISEDEGPVSEVRQFVAAHKMNYRVAMTTPEIERGFPGIVSIPTTYVIDRDGRVAMRHAGMLNPRLTEAETRSLAGLSVDAKVERVDRVQRAQLENGAQATKIPGVDLSGLSTEQRSTALQRLNAEACTCGCDLSVAKCRIDDPNCGVSLPLAKAMVNQIAKR